MFQLKELAAVYKKMETRRGVMGMDRGKWKMEDGVTKEEGISYEDGKVNRKRNDFVLKHLPAYRSHKVVISTANPVTREIVFRWNRLNHIATEDQSPVNDKELD